MTSILSDASSPFIEAALRRLDDIATELGTIHRHMAARGCTPYQLATIARAVVAADEARRALLLTEAVPS